MSRWLDRFAYKISIDAWIFVYSGAFAIGVAFFTVSMQAIKAARVNPTRSLKSD